MSFLSMFNPFTSGYIYGMTLCAAEDDIKDKVINTPIITTIDVLSTGCVYALTADLTSKVLLPQGGKNVLTSVLFAVAGYKLYKFMKKYSSKSVTFDVDEKTVTEKDNLTSEPTVKEIPASEPTAKENPAPELTENLTSEPTAKSKPVQKMENLVNYNAELDD